MNRLLDWSVRRMLLDEEAWVHDHQRARHLVARAGVWVVLVLAATATHAFAPPGPWTVAAAVVLGGWAGVGAVARIGRAQGYRNGWLAGRTQMVAALDECMRRGMGLDDWIAGELDRDRALLGDSVRLAQDRGEGQGPPAP